MFWKSGEVVKKHPVYVAWQPNWTSNYQYQLSTAVLNNNDNLFVKELQTFEQFSYGSAVCCIVGKVKQEWLPCSNFPTNSIKPECSPESILSSSQLPYNLLCPKTKSTIFNSSSDRYASCSYEWMTLSIKTSVKNIRIALRKTSFKKSIFQKRITKDQLVFTPVSLFTKGGKNGLKSSKKH